MTDILHKVYPDTKAGAMECLKALANESHYAKRAKAPYRWRPGEVSGIWEVVRQPKGYVDGVRPDPVVVTAVYMCGYQYPTTTNDFEDFDDEE